MRVITATAHPGRYFGPIMATTYDGKLACGCDARGDCTCKLAPTRDAKPKYGIGHPALITAVMALRNISDRLDRVEEQYAKNQSGMAQGQQPHEIVTSAAQKAAQLSAELYRDKIENAVAEHHEKKADETYRQVHGDPSEPGHAQPQQRPDIDMEAYKHGAPLDESSGDGRQKTTQHPLGKSRVSNDGAYVTPAEAKAMFEAHEREQKARRAIYENECAKNRSFNANQHAMIKEIQAINDKAMKERWK